MGRYGSLAEAESQNMNEKAERRITVDDKDIELDVVAAHIGLARIQLYHSQPIQREDGVKNLEIAALEYDDPMAFFELARHLETVAREQSKDDIAHRQDTDPLDHEWMRLVSHEWLEYITKAAVSGHAIACYQLG